MAQYKVKALFEFRCCNEHVIYAEVDLPDLDYEQHVLNIEGTIEQAQGEDRCADCNQVIEWTGRYKILRKAVQ